MNKSMLPSKVQEQGSVSKFNAFIQHHTGGQSQCSKAKKKRYKWPTDWKGSLTVLIWRQYICIQRLSLESSKRILELNEFSKITG